MDQQANIQSKLAITMFDGFINRGLSIKDAMALVTLTIIKMYYRISPGEEKKMGELEKKLK